MKLVISQNTVLKPSDAQSSTIAPAELAMVFRGAEYPVLAYREEGDHLVVTLDPAKADLGELHGSGKNTWYVYKGHIHDPEGFGPNNRPTDQEAIAPPKVDGGGIAFSLPGYTQTFWSHQSVSSNSPNVTWREALHFGAGGDYRRPESPEIVKRLIRVAEEAQKIRAMFGDRPMRIHSCYRDSVTNARVGGARLSQHVQGGAIDFSIQGVDVMTIYNRLNGTWPGGLAYSRSMGFVHIDTRQGRARWAYPGG